MRARWLVAVMATVGMSGLVVPPAWAGEGVSYQNPVTADRPVPVPPTPSCTVTLASDYVTNAPSGAPQDYQGTFDPPAGCPGPWAKVVLHWTGQEAGRQYDRAGEVTLGGAEIFFTSTPEPDPAGITWHAEKDVTEYTSLFTPGQPYTISVPNYLNSVDTGVMHISVSLTFYEPDAAYPAPRTPNEVIGLGTQYLASPQDVATFHLTGLPRNLTRALVEVYPKGNACDEFWYGGLPNDFVSAHPSAGLCGGGPYREIDVSLDGQPAGATIPFPNIFTGGINPLLWRPIPAVDAFNLQPRDINLTPFVGQLTDGDSHALTMSITNAQSYWSLTPNLLLYTDPSTSQTTGALTEDTLSQPTSITASEQTGAGHVNYTVSARRSGTLSGWVQTPSGRVTTTITTSLSFANTNVFELRNYRQQTTSNQTLETVTTTQGPSGTEVSITKEQDPLTAVEMFQQPTRTNWFLLPAHVVASKTVVTSQSENGTLVFASRLANTTSGSGVLSEYDSGQYRLANGTDRQTYEYSDSTGVCYDHRITAAQGSVTSDRLSTSC